MTYPFGKPEKQTPQSLYWCTPRRYGAGLGTGGREGTVWVEGVGRGRWEPRHW